MRFDDATYIMESKAIAAELEKRYPDPPLHPERPVVAEAQAKVKVCLGVLYPILLPAGSRNLLNPRSEEFFEVDRKRRFGASLADIEKTQGGERVWEKVKEPAAALAEIFKREKGPFVEGEQGMLSRGLLGD
jgi:glutathione S-transferase